MGGLCGQILLRYECLLHGLRAKLTRCGNRFFQVQRLYDRSSARGRVEVYWGAPDTDRAEHWAFPVPAGVDSWWERRLWFRRSLRLCRNLSSDKPAKQENKNAHNDR